MTQRTIHRSGHEAVGLTSRRCRSTKSCQCGGCIERSRGSHNLTYYVQVATDTPSVNAKAWSLIESKVSHILANPCKFHCLNLFFKHVLQGDKSDRQNPSPPIEVATLIVSWTKEVEQWFTNKDKPRAELLAECEKRWPSGGPRRMRKYAETRAAVAFRV